MNIYKTCYRLDCWVHGYTKTCYMVCKSPSDIQRQIEESNDEDATIISIENISLDEEVYIVSG